MVGQQGQQKEVLHPRSSLREQLALLRAVNHLRVQRVALAVVTHLIDVAVEMDQEEVETVKWGVEYRTVLIGWVCVCVSVCACTHMWICMCVCNCVHACMPMLV